MIVTVTVHLPGKWEKYNSYKHQTGSPSNIGVQTGSPSNIGVAFQCTRSKNTFKVHISTIGFLFNLCASSIETNCMDFHYHVSKAEPGPP